jgi:hypothetical protein
MSLLCLLFALVNNQYRNLLYVFAYCAEEEEEEEEEEIRAMLHNLRYVQLISS